jgi:ribonuclease P protein component
MKGKRLSADGLSLFYSKNEKGNVRIGIAVSKKLANAVTRNRIRRRIRDCVMKTLRNQTISFDLVFVAQRELINANYEKIMIAVETVLRRTALRKQTQ